jgi:SlyX protein
MHSTDTQDTTDQRLTHLEIKASFTEDLLEQLDLVVIRQQQQIDLLVREVSRLQQRNTEGLGGPRSPTDDLPPHY